MESATTISVDDENISTTMSENGLKLINYSSYYASNDSSSTSEKEIIVASSRKNSSNDAVDKNIKENDNKK